MDLLAQSLRYWVVQKQNSDPGWKNVRLISSSQGLSLIIFSRYSFKWLYPTRVSLARESTKSWTLFAGSEFIPLMTPILSMRFMVW